MDLLTSVYHFPTAMKGSLKHGSVEMSDVRLSKPPFITDGKASHKIKETKFVL